MRLALALMILLGCRSGDSESAKQVNRDTLSQRQRDSILAQSKIPGARGVGSAMRVADSVTARVQAQDTIGGP